MRYRVVYLVESRSFKCSVFLFLCDLRLSETIKVDLILSYLILMPNVHFIEQLTAFLE